MIAKQENAFKNVILRWRSYGFGLNVMASMDYFSCRYNDD